MSLQNLEIFRLIEELNVYEKTSEDLIELSQRASEVAKILAERGILAETKECREFLNKIQNNILDLTCWQTFYSCLMNIGIKHVLGIRCVNVGEIDVRVLRYEVSKENTELLKILDEEAQEKVCKLIKDVNTFKEFDEILSNFQQILLKIYTTRKECVYVSYRRKVLDLLRKYDLKLLLQELRKALPTNILQSLDKLGVEEKFISELVEGILNLETSVKRPILKYLVLQLKGLEKLKKKLIDECVCVENPVVFRDETVKFLEDLMKKTIKLSELLERVEELRGLASELSKAARIYSLNDIVKIVELVKKMNEFEVGVSRIEELIEILLNNATSEGKVDFVTVYEEVRKRNARDLLDTLVRLCKEGAFECIIQIR